MLFDLSCCCGLSCSLWTDSFDGPDTTGAIPNGWTKTAGTWEILSNELKTTSSNAFLSNTAFDKGKYKVRIKVVNSGDEARIIMSGASATQFRGFGLVVGTSACVRLYSNVGSTLYKIMEYDCTAAANTWLTVEVNWKASQVNPAALPLTSTYITEIKINGVVVVCGPAGVDDSMSGAVNLRGLATGTVTGAVYFDDFENSSSYEDTTLGGGMSDAGCDPREDAPPMKVSTSTITLLLAGLTGSYAAQNGTHTLTNSATFPATWDVTKSIAYGGAYGTQNTIFSYFNNEESPYAGRVMNVGTQMLGFPVLPDGSWTDNWSQSNSRLVQTNNFTLPAVIGGGTAKITF